MMNIKKRNFIVTALGSLMIMGTLISPASAAKEDIKILNLPDPIQMENSDDMIIKTISIEAMRNPFDQTKNTEDKNKIKENFDSSNLVRIETAEIDLSDLSKVTLDDLEKLSDEKLKSMMLETKKLLK